MIKFNVRVNIDNIDEDVKRAINRAQFILDQQVIKDSNFYVPMDSTELEGSTLRASSIGEGKIVWNTPYARRLYYNPQYDFSSDKNPNAQGLWFEHAKATHKKDWIKIVKQTIKDNL